MLDLKILEDLLEDKVPDNLTLLFESLTHEISTYLDLPPFYSSYYVQLYEPEQISEGKEDSIFMIGVKRSIENGIIKIKINQKYVRFLEFILLREAYNLFVDDDLRDYNLVQLVINEIIINDLKKSPYINEWRQLIRKELDSHDTLTRGVSRLSDFDHLERFFKLQGTDDSLDPTQFFFYYLRRNKSLIHDRLEDIHEVFFEGFLDYTSKSMNKNEVIETLRCIIEIFYREEDYQNLLSYKNLFQEFKDRGELGTDLSLRKFESNMRWIKNYSFIAPSYQLNWRAINIDIIPIFLRFNPYLKKKMVFQVIEQFPFFISPKISSTSFAVELCGYIILPKDYLPDFLAFIKKLEDSNYIISYYCLSRDIQWHLVNLNYFREYFQKKRIPNSTRSAYDSNYEIEFHIDFGDKFSNPSLSLLQYLLLDRIRWFSVSGLGFERRGDTLNTLKSDLLNEIISQRSIIKHLREILGKFHTSEELRAEFIGFLDTKSKFGFFYIRTLLSQYLTTLGLLTKTLQANPHLKNLSQVQEFVNSHSVTPLIEDNLLLSNKEILKVIYQDIVSLYFISKTDFQKTVKKYQNYSEFINICYNLKIFDFSSMKSLLLDKNLVDDIYQQKDEKLKTSFERYKLYEITSQRVDELLHSFLNSTPPLISPLLINTIITKPFEEDYLEVILNDSEETRAQVNELKKYFPRIMINATKNLFMNNRMLYIEISTPTLTPKEKERLLSIFYNKFKEDLFYIKPFLWSGLIKGFSSKSFYDFERKSYLYTANLFNQYFLFIKAIFGAKTKRIGERITKSQDLFWSKERKMESLIDDIERNDYLRSVDLKLLPLRNLLSFSENLRSILLDEELLKQAKKEYYFNNYVHSIKLIPAFHKFGLEQFYLFILPTDIDEIDLKLLLINSFQEIQYPISLNHSHSLFIKYIMPYRNPNLSYIHWLLKSKKIIREYCAFFIKKIYSLFHLNFNLVSDAEGWNYIADKFKIYMQNILFNPEYDIHLPEMRFFDIGEDLEREIHGIDSAEYESLIHVYNWESLDVKTYLGTKHLSRINHIMSLLDKNLVFPYISYKNIELEKEVQIVLPSIKREKIDSLIKIFSYFNLGFIFEIEGEFYIHGFQEEVKFENGLFIKLYFPPCELSEFFTIFNKLFEYLEIDYYMFLYDLADGKTLLESFYGNLNFLKSYNPLKNLIWNEKDRIWMNHKLFDEKFQKLYPDLSFEQEK